MPARPASCCHAQGLGQTLLAEATCTRTMRSPTDWPFYYLYMRRVADDLAAQPGCDPAQRQHLYCALASIVGAGRSTVSGESVADAEAHAARAMLGALRQQLALASAAQAKRSHADPSCPGLMRAIHAYNQEREALARAAVQLLEGWLAAHAVPLLR